MNTKNRQNIILGCLLAPIVAVEILWQPLIVLIAIYLLSQFGVIESWEPTNFLFDSDNNGLYQTVIMSEILLLACVWYVLCRIKIINRTLKIIKRILLTVYAFLLILIALLSSMAFLFDARDYEGRIMINIALFIFFIFFYALWVDVNDPEMGKIDKR